MTESPEDIVGHKTTRDGRHVPLRRDEAETIMAHVEAAQAKRAADMPTEQDAIDAMFNAWLRLKELGWSEAINCPKDGSSFDVIETGSTGIFRCHYQGIWPHGSWWIENDGDIYTSRPVLYRLDPEAEAARKARMGLVRQKYLAKRKATP